MNEKYNLNGGCTCGKVKYSISEKPLFSQACHCVDCKISTGSSYVIHTTILDKTLSVDGKVSSTKPLSYQGTLIDNIKFTFKTIQY